MCCGNRGGRVAGAANRDTWTVTYPDGSTVTKSSEIAAKLAAGARPGATWVKNETPNP